MRLARKTQSLDILYEIATSLSQPGSLEQLLDGFLDTFIELVDARAASVRLATGDGHTRLIASRGLAPEVVERDRLMPAGGCPCGWAASEGGLRIQRGTAPCAALIGRPMLERDCAEFVVVPVQYQDRILGVYNLFLDRPLAAMGEDMPDLLISVGRHLGLAIEKARLESEARRLAIMEERNIIGNELHDSLAQSLIGMRLQLKMLGESLARKDFGAAQYEANAPAPRDDAGERRPARPADQLPAEDRRRRAGADGRQPGRALRPGNRHRGVLPERMPGARAHAGPGDPGVLHHPGGAHQHPQAQRRAQRAHHAQQRG